MLFQQLGQRTYRHGHLACGIGSGASGFNDAEPRVGALRARFECAGGIDVDAGAIRHFEKLTGVPGTVMDLFSRDQYISFHGKEPPAGWREATPADVRRAFGDRPLDVLFSSPPCKGLTSLLTPSLAGSRKYAALNELTLRTIWLALESFRSDPIKIILLENVPGLGTRGRHLVEQMKALLYSYGYAVNEDVHDCGEIGGLAQHRRRFLLIARHIEKVPPFIYRPEKLPMKGIGDVIGHLPLPGDPRAGPMHRIPALQWKTWLRLAFVEAGRDWRSLSELDVVDGHLRDWGLASEDGTIRPCVDQAPLNHPHNRVLGVQRWNSPSGTVAGASRAHNGAYSVADPRCHADATYLPAGIPSWRIVPLQQGQPVGSPLPTGGRGGRGKYRVTRLSEPTGTVIAASTTGEGAFAVADDLAYPATPGGSLPAPDEQVLARIIARDGTWHRPITPLEAACLQSIVDPREIDWDRNWFDLDGANEQTKREWVGNAVPRAAAKGMANAIGTALLLADSGERFTLSSQEIWATPLAISLSLSDDRERPAL